MKILHLASEYPPLHVYGLGRFVHGLARAQAALGHEVHVLTNSSGGAEDDARIDGVHVHRIAFPNPPQPPDGHGEVLQFNHGASARALDRRAAFADLDILASHDWLTAIAARELAAELGCPLVVTFHDEVNGKRLGRLDAADLFARDLEAMTAHDAALVIANSAFIAGQVRRHYGVPHHRLVAIPGGIDPAVVDVAAPGRVCDFRSALAADDEILVTYVGRLDAEKGVDMLADALLRLAAGSPAKEVRSASPLVGRPALRLAIAGAGREEAPLRTRLAPLGDRAIFLGYVGGETLAYLYRASDCAPDRNSRPLVRVNE